MHISDRITRVWRELSRHSLRRTLTTAAHTSVDLERVHFGWYVSREFWQSLRPEDQHLTRMVAIHRSAISPPIFSHLSAAVLLDLPAHADFTGPAHITTRVRGSNRPSRGLTRHARSLTESEIVEVHGMRCTSPDRTALDMCALAPAETVLSFLDSHLRANFRVGRAVDEERLSWWRSEITQQIREAKGMRGIRVAPKLVSLADPRKDSVLESISHLQLHRLGFAVRLQSAVPGPNGTTYYPDFEFLGLRLFGECDGKVKYTDPAMLGTRSAHDRVYRDKRRDDWIQGSTNSRVIHWGYPEGATELAMAKCLRAFNVPIPRPPW